MERHELLREIVELKAENARLRDGIASLDATCGYLTRGRREAEARIEALEVLLREVRGWLGDKPANGVGYFTDMARRIDAALQKDVL